VGALFDWGRATLFPATPLVRGAAAPQHKSWPLVGCGVAARVFEASSTAPALFYVYI
jgi:hypothetical protein